MRAVFDNNIEYLLNVYPVEDILHLFRKRAGDPNPPGEVKGWEAHLNGSLAGLFLMGSGNALRWTDNPALQDKMDTVIDGIDRCKQANGFIMAYKETETIDSPVAAKNENPNYVRSKLVQGLIEAGIAGNPRALPLARGHQDWFNKCEYLPRLRGLFLWYQGMIPNTRMYFTPMGRKEDLEVVQEYYQEDWWLEQLAEGDETAIYKRARGESHCYELTAFLAYLDMYRATGTGRYLDAVDGAWNMIHDKWEHIGASIAIECHTTEYPPGSYYLSAEAHTGEMCASVFWLKLNQRYHRLYPDEEKYVSEIEKTIYNVGVAGQIGTELIRYRALLHDKKERLTWKVTCCEIQGTRLLGSLPEYLYSIAPDGLYVDMYSDSEITWDHNGTEVTLSTSTAFPENNGVEISISTPSPVTCNLRLRIPSWAACDVEITINGSSAATGKPGTYCAIERKWNDGDIVSFRLTTVRL